MKSQDSKHAKLITLSFVLFSLIVFIVARIIFESLASNFGSVGRYWDMTVLQHGVPVGVAVLSFFALQMNSKTVLWAEEVLNELFKVVFPSRRDTIALSVVCSVLILLAGVFLGLFDFLATQAIKMMIQL